jgi:hypothetical protein
MTTDTERSQDVYEAVGSYPQPPLVPLPKPGELETLERMGVILDPVSERIIRATMAVTGFNRFLRDLPGKLEPILRRTNVRLPGVYSPAISATLAFQDDPRSQSPCQRAAALVFAAHSLYEDVFSGRLPADEFRGQPLEMGQYPNLFSTSLILDHGQPRMFKSANTSRLVVIIRQHFYALEVGALGTDTHYQQLVEALEELCRRSGANEDAQPDLGPGVVTCADLPAQQRAFAFWEKDPAGAEALQALRHSFLTVCIEPDDQPESYYEAARRGHTGHCANRWFHSSLQLVVFGNTKACAICNFTTYLDGNTMMRAAAEITRRAKQVDLGQTGMDSLPAAKELSLPLPPALLEQARLDLRAVLDTQPATFEIQGFGRSYFAKHQLEAVPTFILALQMAAQRWSEKPVHIGQFLTMSKYRCMDLVNAMVTTPEVLHFVELMKQTPEAEAARQALRLAIDSQDRECRKMRRMMTLDDIFAIYLQQKKFPFRFLTFAAAFLMMFTLRRMGRLKLLPTEIVVSHPEIYPEVPVVGRPGARLPYARFFGLHYQIWDDRIVITFMPGVNWKAPNVELCAAIEEGLKKIDGVVGEQ